MRRSEDRILTTHTGSLPRPPELTRLFVRRARGESVDPAELERLGQAALRGIVRKQTEAGTDIGNTFPLAEIDPFTNPHPDPSTNEGPCAADRRHLSQRHHPL